MKGNSFCSIVLDSIDSTNSYARRIIDNGQYQQGIMVVAAEQQTSGRGMQGNHWESARGENLTFSIICQPEGLCASRQFVVSEAIALSIKAALGKYADGISIKWPNDIYWNDCKLGGILIECDLRGKMISNCIIGVGINVNQTVFISNAPNPVSLKNITGNAHDRNAILTDIASHFAQMLECVGSGGEEQIHSIYLDSLYRKHGFYAYEDAEGRFMAEILDVEPAGYLILNDTQGKRRRYEFKEVKFIL